MKEFVLPAGDKRDDMLAKMIRFVHSLPKDQRWKMTWEPYKPKRSNQQNKALFGHAYKILREETGHSVEELHDHFCRQYFGEVEYEIAGKPYTKPRRTTTKNEEGKRDVMSWADFSDFYASIEQQAAELAIFIPPPDPEWWRNAA